MREHIDTFRFVGYTFGLIRDGSGALVTLCANGRRIDAPVTRRYIPSYIAPLPSISAPMARLCWQMIGEVER
jgi:hypothetical protein